MVFKSSPWRPGGISILVSRSPRPPHVWRPKSSPRCSVIFPPSRCCMSQINSVCGGQRAWRRVARALNGMAQNCAPGNQKSCVYGRNGRCSMPCACTGIMRLHLPTWPHLCPVLIKRGGKRNERRRVAALGIPSGTAGPQSCCARTLVQRFSSLLLWPIQSAYVYIQVLVRLVPLLLQRPLHLFILPWSAISTHVPLPIPSSALLCCLW